jgi:3-oxoacyl-[acyl-carrier protein] reductase
LILYVIVGSDQTINKERLNMTDLKGKAGIITGVSRSNGIGFGIARRLASRGANLLLHSFSPYEKMMGVDLKSNESEQILEQLAEYQVSVEQLESDLEIIDSPQEIIDRALKCFSQIDILILNHTHDTLKTLDELDSYEIDRHLSVNVRASLQLIQKFADHFDAGKGGRIIMLTSGGHLGPMPHPAYVASKGALHHLTLSLSDILAPKGITVNTVNPGPTLTYQPDEEIYQAVLDRMPAGRWGNPDDAARLISWLVSDEAEWITGQVIDSEGGFRRG